MKFPVLIYDDYCASCTNFAKITNRMFRGKITILGHYTQEGRELKQKIFPKNYDGTEMSWFVTENKAYGGRKVLIQLLKYLFSTKRERYQPNKFDLTRCTTDCNKIKGVIIRSCSILSNSKIIEY